MNPILNWYARTTGSFVDKMCCSSYSSHVCDDEERVSMDSLKSQMIVPDWIKEYDGTIPPRSSKGQDVSLHKDKKGAIKNVPCSPERSIATATTVSTSTVRTANTSTSMSTLNTSNRTLPRSNISEQRNTKERIIVDDIEYVRHGSFDDCNEKTIQKSFQSSAPSSAFRKYRADSDPAASPPQLRTVPSDALPSMPYLTLTEGYQC